LNRHRLARLGLARTFQTIRIFENLSVIENVKVAAACHTPTSLFNIVTSNARQQQSEAEINSNAREALEIVGLAGRANDHAKQLPYAQQRLLDVGLHLGKIGPVWDEATGGFIRFQKHLNPFPKLVVRPAGASHKGQTCLGRTHLQRLVEDFLFAIGLFGHRRLNFLFHSTVRNSAATRAKNFQENNS
jgi:hypothetical protein